MIDTQQHDSCRTRVTRAPGSRHVPRARKPRAQLLPIMELRSFDFSSIVARQEIDVVLCPALCVLAYNYARLLVRVHALTMSSGQLLQFLIWGTLPSQEDPAKEFIDSTWGTNVDIDSTTGAPSLIIDKTDVNPNAYLKISLHATQAPTSAPPLRATLSACLLLWTG